MGKKVFIKAVEIGVKNKFPHWHTTNVGILGIAIADLLMERLQHELYNIKFDEDNVDEVLKKLMKLSFLFLTRRLEISSSNAHDIYEKRAYLVKNYGAAFFNKQVSDKSGIISDHYYSSLEYAEHRFIHDAQNQMQKSKQLCQKYYPNITDERIDEELLNIAEQGMIQNYQLYHEILKEYENNELSIQDFELEEYLNSHKELLVA